jgi:4-amino-4-deoxy-L-arabinose transferase-like glycosyltransferase
MTRFLDRIPVARALFGLCLLVFAIVTTIAASQRFELPQYDSAEYLGYARSIYLTGTYAQTPDGPAKDSGPGREPLYPVLIAGTAHLLDGFGHTLGDTLSTCYPLAEACSAGLRPLVYVNAILVTLAAVLVALTAIDLGTGRLGALLGAGYVALNFELLKEMHYVISDYLAVVLTAASGLALARAVRSGHRLTAWGAAGCAIGLLALTKNVFLPLAATLTVWLCVHGLWRLRHLGPHALAPAVAFGLVAVTLCGGWAARNVAYFGTATDGRTAISLSLREVYNDMTPAEHAAAFVVWLRGPGDALASKWFLPESLARFDETRPDSFYQQGQIFRHEARLERLMRDRNLTRSAASAASTVVVLAEIVTKWPGYLLSMPALFYRGLWADEFIVVGLPLLALLLARTWYRPQSTPFETALLMALCAGLWSLVAYPALSLNIPRYQDTAIPAFALATAISLDRFLKLRRP